MQKTAEQILAEVVAEQQALADADTGIDWTIYARDPALWFDHFVANTPASLAATPPVQLHDYQRAALDAFKTHDRVSVRGPHGLGKTFMSSFLVLWFATVSTNLGVDWTCCTTATANRQLTKFLWPSIRRMVRYVDWEALGIDKPIRHKELLDLSLKIGDGEAYAAASDDPTNLEGVHGRRILYLYDEAKGIPVESWEATEGAFSNAGEDTDFEAFAFSCSTPGAKVGEFYEQQRGNRAAWHPVRVTLQDTIDAKQNSQKWAESRAEDWGEGSAVYRTRVLGDFASDDEFSLIPLSWVEQSNELWLEMEETGFDYGTTSMRYGIDVARHGKDLTVKARRRGRIFLPLETEAYTDNVSELGDQVAGEMRQSNLVTSACVDADGMGAGTADRMRTLLGDDRVTVFHGNGHDEWTDASGELRAFNNRSAAWYNVYEWLNPARHDRLLLPPNNRLLTALTGPRLVADGSGKIKLESKEQTKKRLGRSPDEGDAIAYACWAGPPEAAPAVETVGYGAGGREAVGAYQRRRR